MPQRAARAGLLGASLALVVASCGTSSPQTVRLSSATAEPTATATAPASGAEAPAPAASAPVGEEAIPPPAPDTGTPGLALRTRRPTDGFDLTPPQGFSPVEYHPDHGKSMRIDGHDVGIRFYHKHGTGQSVLIAVWSDRSAGSNEALERYQQHTGNVQRGRHVAGTVEAWELRERSAPGASTRTNLGVHLPDGTVIAVNGTNIDDVSLLYDFLTRIEDAPGSLVPKPDAGQAVPGGVTD